MVPMSFDKVDAGTLELYKLSLLRLRKSRPKRVFAPPRLIDTTLLYNVLSSLTAPILYKHVFRSDYDFQAAQVHT